MESAIAGCESVLTRELGLPFLDELWLWKEVVERNDTFYCRLQCLGNHRIRHIGEMRLAVNIQIVNLRVIGSANLGSGSAEVDEEAAVLDSIYCESMSLQPRRNSLDILRRGSVVLRKLIRGQPLMVVRRTGILLIGDQLH